MIGLGYHHILDLVLNYWTRSIAIVKRLELKVDKALLQSGLERLYLRIVCIAATQGVSAGDRHNGRCSPTLDVYHERHGRF